MSEPCASSGPRPLRVAPILTLAFLLRALAAFFMFRTDPRIWFYNQASELTCLAHSLLSGHGLSSPFGGSTGPSAFLAPGYPLLVAFVYRLMGASSFNAAAVLATLNMIFGTGTVLVVMLVARRTFGNRVAGLAGALCAISPTMIYLPMLFWETSLSTLFLTGIALVALRCIDRPGKAAWTAFGGYCALAMLVNPSLLITFVGVGAWAAYTTRKVSRSTPWLAVGACALLFSIWPIRNAIVLHAFVPLRSNLGYELWQGNRPGSQGLFSPDIYLNASYQEYSRYAALGELTYLREKSLLAQAAIKGDPLRFVRLSLKRFAIFWTALGGHGISGVVIGEISLISGCAAMSLVCLLRRRSAYAMLFLVPFLVFPLPYYITHPDFRFRLLLEPLALLLTAWLADRCYGRVTFFRANAQ